jgi:hypothetical protein
MSRYRLVDLSRITREQAIGKKRLPVEAAPMKFNSLQRAQRELGAAFPKGGWLLMDMETGQEVT